MKYSLLLLLALLFTVNSVQSQNNSRHVKVKGYHRKDGTYVRPHYRTAPNSTNRDNFSTRGNVNPYTGKSGWIQPDGAYTSTSNRQTSVRKRQKQYNTTSTTNYYEQRKVGKYPNGYVYAITRSSGQLWQTANQIDVIRAVPRNSFVRVLGYEDEFWKVIIDGATGYVHDVTMDVNSDMVHLKTKTKKRYRSVVLPDHRNSTTPAYSVSRRVEEVKYASWSSVQPGKCTASNRRSLINYQFVVQTAYLSNRPAAEGKPVGKLKFGDKVNVICSEGEWYEVAYEGRTGWIEKRLLRK